MSSTAPDLPRRHRYTRAEYYRMAEAGIFGEDDRVELIEGEIIDMAPTGSQHAGTLKFLARTLQRIAADRAIVSVQDPLHLDEFSEPEPDLALLQPRDDFYRAAHPQPQDVLLVIEVAESSLAYDRDVKLPLYARHGIPEAWLVDLDGRRLERYAQPQADGYAVHETLSDLASVPLPAPTGGPLDLRGLFPGD